MTNRSPRYAPLDGAEPHAATLGASILCYAVAPHTGELFFLLGKESGGAGDARLDCDPACAWQSPAHRATTEAATNDMARRDGGVITVESDVLPSHIDAPASIVDPVLAHGSRPDECDSECDDESEESESAYGSSDPSDESSDDASADVGCSEIDHSSDDNDNNDSSSNDNNNASDQLAIRNDKEVTRCTEDTTSSIAGTVHAALGPGAPHDALARSDRDAHGPAREDAHATAAKDIVPSPPLTGQRRVRRTHRWCDFGGRIEPGESQEEAAAREFFEETLGVVCTDSCARSAHRDAARGSIDVGAPPGVHGEAERRALAADLAAGRYAFKVRTCLNHGADPMVPRRYHVTFVKRIPWTPSVVLQFARLRCELAAVARAARQHRPPADTTIKFDDGSAAVAAPESHDHSHGDAQASGKSNDDADLRHVCDHVTCKRNVSEEPATRAALSPDGRVRDECIEKDYIQFWSVRRLRQALDNGGCFRREHLRPLFMPTIAVVLDVMTSRRPHYRNHATAGVAIEGDVPWHPSTHLTMERVDGASVYTVRCRTPLRRAHYHARAQPGAHSRGLVTCDHDANTGQQQQPSSPREQGRQRSQRLYDCHDDDGDDDNDNEVTKEDCRDERNGVAPSNCNVSVAPTSTRDNETDTHCVLN
nr:nudix hydrolase domain [Pandoravirus massiliensis]